jgi:hypothetical protein
MGKNFGVVTNWEEMAGLIEPDVPENDKEAVEKIAESADTKSKKTDEKLTAVEIVASEETTKTIDAEPVEKVAENKEAED